MPGGFHSLLSFILSAAFSVHPPLDQWWLKSHSSLGLRVQERGDQLVITWNPYAVRKGHAALLQVNDGPKRMTWFMSPELRSITYVRETDDTQVRLSSEGKSQTEVVLSLSAQLQPPAAAVRLDGEPGNFARDLADVRVLRTKIQNENRRLALLQKEALLLLNTVPTKSIQNQF